MSVRIENIHVNLNKKNNELNLTGLNVTDVEEYNNGRISPVSDPRSPSPIQSFFQKAKEATKKVSKVFQRPSSPTLSFDELQTTHLYELGDSYLQTPSPKTLALIRQEVKGLGYKNPIVQTMRSYAEGVFENAAYTREGKVEKNLVNALGGSTLSTGGGPTRKRKRHSRKKITRKH